MFNNEWEMALDPTLHGTTTGTPDVAAETTDPLIALQHIIHSIPTLKTTTALNCTIPRSRMAEAGHLIDQLVEARHNQDKIKDIREEVLSLREEVTSQLDALGALIRAWETDREPRASTQ